jgi:hypothetical protein
MEDKNNVYYGDEKIDWADPNSFRVLNDCYARDKNFVYYGGEKID